MNWLAHIVLAGPDPADQLGGVLADLVPMAQARALPAALQRGLALHQAIDAFTDRHPIVGRSCRRLNQAGIGLPPAAAGIAVDMLFDHLLAVRWPRDADWPVPVPLSAFTARFYASAPESCPLEKLPERASMVLRRMAADDWLASYQDIACIRQALEGIRRRLSPRAAAACPLPAAVDVFMAHRAAFDEDFTAFWPDLQAYVRRWSHRSGIAAEPAPA